MMIKSNTYLYYKLFTNLGIEDNFLNLMCLPITKPSTLSYLMLKQSIFSINTKKRKEMSADSPYIYYRSRVPGQYSQTG